MRKLPGVSLSRIERDLGGQGRAASGLTRDGQLAAEGSDAVGQTDEPGPIGGIGSTDSVVVDREVQDGTPAGYVHAYLGGSRVFGRVGERFGDDVVGTHFDGVRQLPVEV
jgi:hypothetical protein